MKVSAVTRDLMDRSKISAAFADVQIVRDAGILDSPDLVLVDLAVPGAVDVAAGTGARVIAYGSHVDEAALDHASDVGAEALPRSVFFRRLANGTLVDE